jgi:hypothetical protein
VYQLLLGGEKWMCCESSAAEIADTRQGAANRGQSGERRNSAQGASDKTLKTRRYPQPECWCIFAQSC